MSVFWHRLISVERDGQLFMLNPARGVLRAELLESGQAVEADLRAEDLAGGFLVGNSVRGLVGGEIAREDASAGAFRFRNT